MATPKTVRPLLAGLCCLWLVAPARAQDTKQADPQTSPPATQTTPPAAQTTPPGAAPDKQVEPAAEESTLTVDEIERRKADADRNANLAEGVKNQILDAYRQAIEGLKRADSARTKKAEFDAARESAPARLADAKAQLASFSDAFQLDLAATAPLADLEARLGQAESDQRDARAAASALDDEQSRRSDRRAELPKLIADVKSRLDAVSTDLSQPTPTDEPHELTVARRVELRARRAAMRAEVESYEAELSSYDARTELIQARKELTAKKATRAANIAKAWQDLVADARRREAQAAAREAARARREAARAHPALRKIAQRNAELADREAVVAKIQQAKQEEVKSANLIQQISAEFNAVTSRVKAAGINPTMGIMLRRLRDGLPSLSERVAASTRRDAEAARARLQWLDLQDDQRRLDEKLDAMVQDVVGSLPADTSEQQVRDISAAAKELLEARQGYIAALIKDYDTYSRALFDLEGKEQQLINVLKEIHNYVGERILWIKSAAFPKVDDAHALSDAVLEFASPENWVDVWSHAWARFVQTPARAFLWLLAIIACFAAGPWAARRTRELGQAASQPFCHSIRPTVVASLLAVVMIARWPALLRLAAWAVVTIADEHAFGSALAAGLRAVSVWVLLLEFLRQLCRPDGLGESHFAWPTAATARVRRHLLWFAIPTIVAVFLSSYAEQTGNEHWNNALGRCSFLALTGLVLAFDHVIFHPKRGALAPRSSMRSPSSFVRFRDWIYAVAVPLPALLIGLSLSGYHYTACRLATGFLESLWLILIIVVASYLALRCMLVYRRKLSIRAFHRRQQAATEADAADIQPDPPIDLNVVTAQVGNLLRAVGVFAFLIGMWAIWHDALPALRVFDQVQIWSTVERVTTSGQGPDATVVEQPVPVTLRDLFASIFIFIVTFIAVRNLPGLIELAILERLQLAAAQRFAITTVSRYVLILVGLVLGFGAIGVGWAKVQWLAAAATVGLGFGLQEIFANFVSGLIILFERPIRLGDVVTVDDVEGRVTRIQMRATTITDWDMRELIVPNKNFITNRVINWTLSDPTTRVIIPVGIAYGSDTALAAELLLKIAQENPDVVGDPEPHVLFKEFGASSLNFELRVYLATRNVWIELVHSLHMTIDQEFRKAGIEIAFPQRDLHVRSVKAPLRVELQRSPGRSDKPTGRGSAPPDDDS